MSNSFNFVQVERENALTMLKNVAGKWEFSSYYR